MKIGMVGLGKMGFNLTLNLLDHGHEVVAYDTAPNKTQSAQKHGATGAHSLPALVQSLGERRVIWLMVPAGDAVDSLIDQLIPLLNKNDIIIDGGNSNYKDTLRRFAKLDALGIDFVDVGTSGGISGARDGACTMIGAKDKVFAHIEQIFADICVENGYLHTGANGSGHFVKMVHNGVEYGMMQAIGEGFDILEKGRFDIDNEAVAKVWSNGSVIRGWLMELAQSAFSKDAQLSDIKDIAHSSGEGLWSTQEALELKVPTPVITTALLTRFGSQQSESFSTKVVAALRGEFGGHDVDKK
ncbi:MAG: decarboxylating 6-phosphogluconate dehydrogenase [Clostridia bacterium]|jgi:6-phosphogluconate dehydrogenase|nr:decarboxylating 6-phosphogluconate dehydrogenase [Clostridia bacterium]MBT7122876.1 decarboxylating 6-phosphogluconate dehydrogenase [Clostridia bacterium]